MTQAVTRMPVKTVTIPLDELGYDGWWVKMRINPPAYVYDGFLTNDANEGNNGREWEAWKVIVLEWNIYDDEGVKLPLPKEGTEKNALPYDIQAWIIREYIEALNATLRIPKGSGNNSETLSLTGTENRTNGSV
jgi:hypothetical protein